MPPLYKLYKQTNWKSERGPIKSRRMRWEEESYVSKVTKKVLLLATIQVSCFHVFAQSLRQIFNWIAKVSLQTIQVFWFNVFAQS